MLDDVNKNRYYLHNMAEAMRIDAFFSGDEQTLVIIIQLPCYLVFSMLDYMCKFDFYYVFFILR